MNSQEFLGKLIASYPEGLRPDVDFVRQIDASLRRKSLSDKEYEYALQHLRESFRMFPCIADINEACNLAHQRVFQAGDVQDAWEYFDIGGRSFARRVKISADRELCKESLPEGATNYHLALPKELEADHDFLSFEQAYAEGCISSQLFEVLSAENPNPKKSRFEKIGNIIKEETQTVKPVSNKPEDFEDI